MWVDRRVDSKVVQKVGQLAQQKEEQMAGLWDKARLLPGAEWPTGHAP